MFNRLEDDYTGKAKKSVKTRKKKVAVQDLVCLDDVPFIYAASKAILLRRPRPQDFVFYYHRLTSGQLSKDDAIVSMRLSPEGRFQDVKVEGFTSCFIRSVSCRLPVIKHLAKLIFKPSPVKKAKKLIPARWYKEGRTLKDKLQIVLITYNRVTHLNRTLEALFDKNSPVRNIDITILDNASDDGTGGVCKEYASRFSNITYVCHPKNIGGNANICRAYEYANKEYIWLLADDDGYDWTFWHQIESAIEKKYDCIFTTVINLCREQTKGVMLYESGFAPACIYRSEHITSDVLLGMYDNIQHFMPHVTIAVAVYKKDGEFFVPDVPIVIQPAKFEDNPAIAMQDYNRGVQERYSPYTIDKFWEVGFLAVISTLDEKDRAQILNDIQWLYGGSDNYYMFMLNNFIFKNYNSRNFFDMYKFFDAQGKKEFLKWVKRNLFASGICGEMQDLDDMNALVGDRFYMAIKDFYKKSQHRTQNNRLGSGLKKFAKKIYK